MSAGAQGGQKRELEPLELGLQVIVSHLMWVLATQLGSFARTACTVMLFATELTLQPLVLLFKKHLFVLLLR